MPASTTNWPCPGQLVSSSQELDGFFDQQVTDNADARIAGHMGMNSWDIAPPIIPESDSTDIQFVRPARLKIVS